MNFALLPPSGEARRALSKVDKHVIKSEGGIMDNEKVFAMSFAKVYPMLIAKAERKGKAMEKF